MLRPVYILLILPLFLAQSFNSLLLVQYEWQKDYYAKERCEQRNLADNHCQGFCQIKALLQEEQSSTPRSKVPNFQEEETNLFFNNRNTRQQRLGQFNFNQTFKLNQKTSKPLNGHLHKIWNPPKF